MPTNMVRVENTMRGARVMHELPKRDKDGKVVHAHGKPDFQIPGATTVAGVKTNGSAEMPEAVLDELLAKDQVTQGWFSSGELIDTRGPQSAPDADAKAKAKANAEGAKGK